MNIRQRIEEWLASSRCNCTGEAKVYCTYCDILLEVLDHMDQNEKSGIPTEETNHVECNTETADACERAAGQLQDQAGAGGDSGASGHEGREGLAESKGSVNEPKYLCEDCKSDSCYLFDGSCCSSEHEGESRTD